MAIIAGLIQIAYQILKRLIIQKLFKFFPDWADQVVVLTLSLATAFILKADLIAMFTYINSTINNSIHPWIGQIFFALIISRGSSGVHNLLEFLETKRLNSGKLDPNNIETPNLQSKNKSTRIW